MVRREVSTLKQEIVEGEMKWRRKQAKGVKSVLQTQELTHIHNF